MHSKVVPSYTEKFEESGIQRDFAEAVWNCYETKGADLRVITLIDEHHTFVRDTAGRRDEVEGDTDDADDNWDFEGMIFVDELAVSEARNKL